MSEAAGRTLEHTECSFFGGDTTSHVSVLNTADTNELARPRKPILIISSQAFPRAHLSLVIPSSPPWRHRPDQSWTHDPLAPASQHTLLHTHHCCLWKTTHSPGHSSLPVSISFPWLSVWANHNRLCSGLHIVLAPRFPSLGLHGSTSICY